MNSISFFMFIFLSAGKTAPAPWVIYAVASKFSYQLMSSGLLRGFTAPMPNSVLLTNSLLLIVYVPMSYIALANSFLVIFVSLRFHLACPYGYIITHRPAPVNAFFKKILQNFNRPAYFTGRLNYLQCFPFMNLYPFTGIKPIKQPFVIFWS